MFSTLHWWYSFVLVEYRKHFLKLSFLEEIIEFLPVVSQKHRIGWMSFMMFAVFEIVIMVSYRILSLLIIFNHDCYYNDDDDVFLWFRILSRKRPYHSWLWLLWQTTYLQQSSNSKSFHNLYVSHILALLYLQDLWFHDYFDFYI